jgi:hypothetical protein
MARLDEFFDHTTNHPTVTLLALSESEIHDQSHAGNDREVVFLIRDPVQLNVG